MTAKPDPSGTDKVSASVFAFLAGGGAVWWQAATHHPGTAIVFGIVAAIAGYAVGTFLKVASRSQDAAADRIYQALGRTGPQFERRYRDFVLSGMRFVDLKGLATIGPFTPELDEVFVDVRLVPQSPGAIKTGVLPALAGDPPGRHQLSDFLGQEKPAILAVIGGPGTGKTTLLRHTAHGAAQGRHRGIGLPRLRDQVKAIAADPSGPASALQQRLGDLGKPRQANRDLPILLYLRDHVRAIADDPDVSVADLLRGTLGSRREEEPEGWFEQKLREGECLVLLDGLDEVARAEDRKAVARWTENQIRQYPGNDFVLSSRPQGYSTAPVQGATTVAVCGFTMVQVQEFVRGWYRAVERHSTGDAGADIEARATKGADDLIRRFKDLSPLRDLAVNPLLLTMIANVHRYRGALPRSRAELYSEICQVMLWRRQDAKNLASELPGTKKETILCGVAYAMMERRMSDLSTAEILAEIAPCLREVSTAAIPEDFLADVSSSGLLIEREAGHFAFAHKTFQEYLAASHIHDNNLVSVLTDAVGDDWWREATLLYAASANADPIIRACLDADTVPAAALAFDCEDQGSRFSPELRTRLDALLTTATEQDCAPDRRRFMAGVSLTRHMRDTIQGRSDARISVHPVTEQIYRFFLADLESEGTNVPPAETTSAFGVRRARVDQFIQWANKISGQQKTYRLPTGTELDELAAHQGLTPSPSGGPACPVWVRPDVSDANAGSALWLAPGAAHPHRIGAAELSAAIASDLDDELQHGPFSFFCSLTATFMTLADLDLNRVLELDRQLNPDLTYVLGLVYNMTDGGTRTSHDLSDFGHDRDLFADCVRNLGHVRVRDFIDDRDGTQDLLTDLLRALDLVLRHASSLASTLGHDLRRVHELDRIRGLASVRVRDLIDDRDSDLADTLDRDLVLASVVKRILDRALDIVRALRFAKTHVQNLSDLLGRVPGLITDRFRDLSLALDLGVNFDLSQAASHTLAGAVGRVLSQAAKATNTKLNGTIQSVDFTAVFTEAAGLAPESEFVVDPDDLLETLSNAVTELRALLLDADPADSPHWARPVADQLVNSAGPVLEYQENAAERATSIRLAALCLAGEVDALKGRSHAPWGSYLGDQFRRIAAGITLLEMRQSGKRPAAEVIMLAVDN